MSYVEILRSRNLFHQEQSRTTVSPRGCAESIKSNIESGNNGDINASHNNNNMNNNVNNNQTSNGKDQS